MYNSCSGGGGGGGRGNEVDSMLEVYVSVLVCCGSKEKY